jgi:hypothetical protein
MIKIIFILLLSTFLSAEYSVGDQISTDHQNLAFNVCYGDSTTEQLSLSDFAGGNTVIWMNMSASW